MNKYYRAAVCLALSLVLVASSAGAQGRKLLLVDLDDLGKEFLHENPQGFFNLLDRYARKYTRHYSCPVCTPTRASMYYGVHTTHEDLRMPWLVGPNHSRYTAPLDGPLVPLGRAVTDAGFSAAKVGKWHICRNDELMHPLDSGWDSYVGVMGNTPDYYSLLVNDNGVNSTVVGEYLTEMETDDGIAAMQAGYDLVSVSYHAIHDPFQVPPAHLWSGTYPTSEYEIAETMLQALSAELLRLTSVARSLGYHLIMFSDNGGLPILGGLKGSVLEPGVNTDMWIYGPGVTPGEFDGLVATYDVYATVCEFFGIQRGPGMGPESVSLFPTLWGQDIRDTVFVERFTENGVDPSLSPFLWRRAVISDQYKYMIRNSMDFLYDLQLNPGENMNRLNNPTASDISAYTYLQGEMSSWTQ